MRLATSFLDKMTECVDSKTNREVATGFFESLLVAATEEEHQYRHPTFNKSKLTDASMKITDEEVEIKIAAMTLSEVEFPEELMCSGKPQIPAPVRVVILAFRENGNIAVTTGREIKGKVLKLIPRLLHEYQVFVKTEEVPDLPNGSGWLLKYFKQIEDSASTSESARMKQERKMREKIPDSEEYAEAMRTVMTGVGLAMQNVPYQMRSLQLHLIAKFGAEEACLNPLPEDELEFPDVKTEKHEPYDDFEVVSTTVGEKKPKIQDLRSKK